MWGMARDVGLLIPHSRQNEREGTKELGSRLTGEQQSKGLCEGILHLRAAKAHTVTTAYAPKVELAYN
jgi:hypothetical protein